MIRKKIVYILGTLDIGGTERQFIELMRHLDRERFDPYVLAFSHTGRLRTEIEALQVPLTSLHFTGLAGKYRVISYAQLFRLFRGMIRFLRQERPHIVQSFLFWANVYGSIAARLAGVPVVLTGRRGLGDKYHWKWHYRWLHNLSNLLATEVIANSNEVRKACLTSEQWLRPTKISVIYNGVDNNRYQPKRPYEQHSEIFEGDGAVIGVIANLHECKGHQYLLQAAAEIIASYPKTKFILIGRDEGVRTSLEAQVQALHLKHAVIFLGERHDIHQLLPEMDIQVSASITEGFSTAILEGMACGLPIIATAVGGSPEQVLDGVTGILIPPCDSNALAQALRLLLHNPALRKQMGEMGRQRVIANFSIDRLIQQTEAVYDRLSEL